MPTLFSTPFPPATNADWTAQVQKDLKDPHAPETLRWQSPEGFLVELYCTADALSSLPLSQLQAAQKDTPGWLNTPEYAVDSGNEKAINAALRDALLNGANALLLNLSGAANLALLLNGIKLSDTPVYFRLAGNVPQFMTTLRQLTPYQIRGGLLAAISSDVLAINALTADSPHFRTITADAGMFHNAGATATQELAFTLARLADTYDELTNAGLTMDELVPNTMISLAVGTSYFPEIAKLRALRVLWQRFIRHYSLVTSHSLFIHATTSPFYEATATPYTNLLRATTEAMAAVIGGADALTVRPYDAVLTASTGGAQTEFSQRIARNVSSLLSEESYLDKVADPAAGSYYIETLTHQLTEAAWAQFLTVEAMGGLAKATTSGYVRRELDMAYRAKKQAVTDGRVLVGVTKFRHDEAGDGTPARLPEDLLKVGGCRLAEDFE